MSITNVFHVLPKVAPFAKFLEKCISMHISDQGFRMHIIDLSAFIVLIIKFALAGTECAEVTALFSESMFAHSAALSRNVLSPGSFCKLCER